MSVEPQPTPQAKPADILGFGIAMAAIGLYIVLVALDVLPIPDGGVRAPAFILVLAGLAFMFAGASLMIRARAGASDGDGDLPATAPRASHIAYRAIGIAIAASLAAIGSWIAIGSGPRHFDMSIPLAGAAPAGNALGRTIFGLGAVIVWIYVIALTVGTVRKIFDRSGK